MAADAATLRTTPQLCESTDTIFRRGEELGCKSSRNKKVATRMLGLDRVQSDSELINRLYPMVHLVSTESRHV